MPLSLNCLSGLVWYSCLIFASFSVSPLYLQCQTNFELKVQTDAMFCLCLDKRNSHYLKSTNDSNGVGVSRSAANKSKLVIVGEWNCLFKTVSMMCRSFQMTSHQDFIQQINLFASKSEKFLIIIQSILFTALFYHEYAPQRINQDPSTCRDP